MASVLWVALLVQLLMLANPGSGVAPGDEEALCEQLRAQGAAPTPGYSSNMRVLMDSWNYQNLLPPRTGAVWDQVDNDDNNPFGVTTNWIQQFNTPCQQSVQVCGFSAGPQDNWLITQLINRTVNGTRLSQVSVTIEFELRNCDITLNCQQTFNTHIYEISTENGTAARNISNYRQVQRVSLDTNGTRMNETIVANFNSEHSSFYFAIQDKSSCLVVTRLLVFYHVCPASSLNDPTRIPERIVDGYAFVVIGYCAENAQTKNNDTRLKHICLPGGVWIPSDVEGQCQCLPGYAYDREKKECICTNLIVPPTSEPVLTPPETEPHCTHVNWRNPPNVSCGDISGYDVRLFNPNTNETVERRVDTRGTFHNFLKSDKDLLEKKSTAVQVRAVSSTNIGPYSSPKEVGCYISRPSTVYFELNKERYENNSMVSILNIGKGDDALFCKTDKQDCCSTRPNRFGEFYYPNGIRVPVDRARQDFYRDRGEQLIRLNRREGTSSLTGRYRCEIPDANGGNQKIFINITQ